MIKPAEMEDCLATAAQMLRAESMVEAAELKRRAEPSVEETGYDNWNGGTTVYTIYLCERRATRHHWLYMHTATR